jgi:hypothetical protein
MTISLTTNHEPGVLAYAMYSLADHIIEHALPAPISIRVDRAADAVVVQLVDDDTPQWAASIHIDTVREEGFRLRDRVATHTICEGRLPVGVRVSLLTVTFAPRLTAVSA